MEQHLPTDLRRWKFRTSIKGGVGIVYLYPANSNTHCNGSFLILLIFFTVGLKNGYHYILSGTQPAVVAILRSILFYSGLAITLFFGSRTSSLAI
ncbi:hypothetical protein [Mucilaginibacter sp. HD30]